MVHEKDFEVIYEGVKELIVYSQIRYNLAIKISSLLKKYLFSIVKSGYENEDFKEAYFVNMINRFGLELRLFVIPNDKDKKINRLKIQYIKRKNSNIKELSDSLLKDLKSEGFDVTIIWKN